jgi:Rap1a immunity proteins
MRWLILFMALISANTWSAGLFLAAKELKQYCSYARDTAEQGMCMGYLMSAWDSYVTWQDWGLLRKDLFCLSFPLVPNDLRDSLMKYFETDPPGMDLGAGGHVINMLSKYYACTK